MSVKDRQKRADKAMKEGREARRAGKPKSACPYKISEWGMGAYWLMGWNHEDYAQKANRSPQEGPGQSCQDDSA